MNEHKIINDPIFGFIKIRRGLLYNIVEHPLFQRLNRIVQLGLASVVYPGARHTRFQHSLGALHLMSEAVKSLTEKGIYIFDVNHLQCQLITLIFLTVHLHFHRGNGIKVFIIRCQHIPAGNLHQIVVNIHRIVLA